MVGKKKRRQQKEMRRWQWPSDSSSSQEGREAAPDMATSPRRQAQAGSGVRPKEPPSMVVQGDFRKVSGISTEIFRQIETVENDHDATTAAALEVVERRGEMVVRMLDPRHMGAAATDAAKKFLMMQDQKHFVHFVEIVKRPGQTLGLYIREGNGLDRCDGVFISRIALESAVYNSGCLKVGDEILAVNLVDVTRMSLDDVVIIMSIPRRLVLTTRQRKSQKGVPSPHLHRTEQKPPPVVVIKKELEEEPVDESTSNGENGMPMMKPPPQRMQQYREPPSRMPHRRSPLDEADLYQEEQYLYYNSRPEHTYRPPSRSHEEAWSYQPPPPVITEQPKPSLPQHFQPYDRGYPKTLESLAEKVHTFYGGPAPPRRAAQPMTSTRLLTPGARPRVPPRGRILRSGSDQHLPRTEHDLYEYVMRPLRSSMKASTMQYPVSGRYADTMQRLGALRRRTPSLDYASDTEATTSGRTSYLLSMTRPYASLRSNSLPRDHRGRHRHMVRFEREPGMLDSQEDSDGAVSAPELPTTRRERGRLPSSPSVFTADEYRAWLQRTPSTSAIYERIRQSRDVLQAQRAARFTYSAENLLDRAREEQPYYSYRSHLSSTLDRPFSARSLRMEPLAASRSSSMRRMRHLLEEGRHIPNPSPTRSADPRVRLLDINPAEFLKYKMDKSMISSGQPGSVGLEPGVSGLLWVHLLAGRGLKSTTRSEHYRDLYCVLECDRVHKARTVVRTGDLIFDWDETFELDLINNHELDFLIYSWDPQYRHKLCYKGSIHLVSLLRESPMHQLALKIEPRGTLYLKLRYTDPRQTFLRTPNPRKSALFGVDLETVVGREGVTGGVPGGVATSVTAATPSLSVPILVKRCVEEVERRGLDIIGLYRLCGSATKKRALREAFERNPRTVDLSPDNVPDINVITGVLKDYLRELPEPLFTKCLYQMLVDALSVCLPDDPEGNAKLMFSILDCLPKVNRVRSLHSKFSTLVFLMDHLSLVVSQSDRNKMAPQNLAVCFGPVLMLQSEEGREQDFHRPISVLKYLLEIWPNKSVRELARPSKPESWFLRGSRGRGRGQGRGKKSSTSLFLSPKKSPGSPSESSPSPPVEQARLRDRLPPMASEAVVQSRISPQPSAAKEEEEEEDEESQKEDKKESSSEERSDPAESEETKPIRNGTDEDGTEND